MITNVNSGYGGPDLEALRQNRFKKTDSNGDGKITKDELSAALPQNSDGNGPSVDEIFAKIDTNQDGAIDDAEDKAAFEQMPQPPHGQHGANAAKLAEKIFSAADSDSSDSISKDELSSLLSKTNSGINADDLFSLLDANSDGAVTQTELTDTLKKMFELGGSTASDQSSGGCHTYSKGGTVSNDDTASSFSVTA